MEAIAGAFYWVRVGAFVLVVVIAVIAAILQSRSTRYAPVRMAVRTALTALAVVALPLLAGIKLAWLILAAALVAGVAIGFIATRGSGGESPIAAWAGAVAWVLVAFALLFGTTQLFGYSFAVLALAAGLAMGQTVSAFASPQRRGLEIPAA